MDYSEIFEKLGFSWNRTIACRMRRLSVREAVLRFNKYRMKFVWETGYLENNPFTYVEVQTLLDGVTVGGHKLSDEDQIRGIADSAAMLAEKVLNGSFSFSLDTMCALHCALAEREALDAGKIRGTGKASGTPNVFLGELGEYSPLPTEKGGLSLRERFQTADSALNAVASPLERGIAAYLFIAKEQPFYDGNKRVGRLMMNGILMSNGIDAVSIPAKMRQEYNTVMCEFYASCRDSSVGDATAAMKFMMNVYEKFIESQRESFSEAK